jgi:LPXTG-motif cell wall-anchored protein
LKGCARSAHYSSLVCGFAETVGAREGKRNRKEKIVYRAKRLAGVGLGVALLAALILGGSALAQGSDSVELELTPSRDSGVTGTATITEVADGLEVTLNMRGLPEAGIKHINHIHEGGSCSADRAGNTAPATIPLKTIVAKDDGTGSGTTTLKGVTLDELFAENKQRYIAFHSEVKDEPVPPVISCADVVRTAGGGAAPGQLPESGGTHPMVLLSAGAALVLGAVAGLLALRRRIA